MTLTARLKLVSTFLVLTGSCKFPEHDPSKNKFLNAEIIAEASKYAKDIAASLSEKRLASSNGKHQCFVHTAPQELPDIEMPFNPPPLPPSSRICHQEIFTEEFQPMGF